MSAGPAGPGRSPRRGRRRGRPRALDHCRRRPWCSARASGPRSRTRSRWRPRSRTATFRASRRQACPGHAGELAAASSPACRPSRSEADSICTRGTTQEVPALLPRLAHALGAEHRRRDRRGRRPRARARARHRRHRARPPQLQGRCRCRGGGSPTGTPAFVEPPRSTTRPGRPRARARGRARHRGRRRGLRGDARPGLRDARRRSRCSARRGATVVGMSMVPESLPAHALGMRVLGICSLTNALGDHVSHEEVLRVSTATASAVGRLLVDLFPRLPRKELEPWQTSRIRRSRPRGRERIEWAAGRCRCSRRSRSASRRSSRSRASGSRRACT